MLKPPPDYRPPKTPPPEPGKLLPCWETPDGWQILQILYSAVPDYDFEDACRSQGEEEIARELLISWQHRAGKAVYPEFGLKHHVSVYPIEYDPNLPLHIGWDWATLPSVVVTQMNAYRQWCVLSALQAYEDTSTGIYEFATWVADHLNERYAAPHGKALRDLSMVHIGDPSGSFPPPRTGDAPQRAGSPKEVRSAFDILKRGVDIYMGHDERGRAIYETREGWGWQVVPGEVSLTKRLEAVRARLTMTLAGGVPAFVVDRDCELVIDAMAGGYHYHERNDGRYELDPHKDSHADVADALGYIATRLSSRPERKADDEHSPKPEKFRSQASGWRK